MEPDSIAYCFMFGIVLTVSDSRRQIIETQHQNPALLDFLDSVHHLLTHWIPLLAGALQSFFGERLDSDERSPDSHLLVHGAQILFIAGSLDGHLSKTVHVFGDRPIVFLKKPQALFAQFLKLASLL